MWLGRGDGRVTVKPAINNWAHLINRTKEQKAYAETRLAKILSASNSVGSFEVRLQDYRDCQEQFDGIASVEMFETAGEKHWPEYF
ncbi:SAM-dependent methyltransferase [Polynucleobacter necessarius]|uniref:SAM-dependent methyltransferase n=1 Tax=Polynucleobacter necessarius TaxID=576610 RepID=UPI002F9459DA